jgi:DNA-binding PadR family transcriptional regulator
MNSFHHRHDSIGRDDALRGDERAPRPGRGPGGPRGSARRAAFFAAVAAEQDARRAPGHELGDEHGHELGDEHGRGHEHGHRGRRGLGRAVRMGFGPGGPRGFGGDEPDEPGDHGPGGPRGFGPGFGPGGPRGFGPGSGPGGPRGFGPGGPGPRGPRGGGRRSGRGGRGDVRAAVLLLLDEAPMHGYQLIQQIVERSGGVWTPSPGSVYPALSQLEDEGLLTIEKVEGRKTASLTEAGTTYVQEHRADLGSPWDDVSGGVTRETVGLREQVGALMGAARQVAHVGTRSQVAAAAEVLTRARKDLYRILADDDSAS